MHNLKAFKNKLILLMLGVFSMSQLLAHVELLYPIGNETFEPGQVVAIEWNVLIPHNTLNWDLSLSLDGGVNWEEIQFDLPVNTVNFQWTVPQTETTQAKIRIIQDNVETNYGDISNTFNISGTTSIEEPLSQYKTKVYPNPFSDYSIIKIHDTGPFHHSLFIYDLKGKLVRNMDAIISEEVVISRENLNSGIYFYFLFQGKDLKANGKFVIQ